MLVQFIRRYVCSSVASMAEVNLDKCLEAAVEVARQAGKVSTRLFNLVIFSVGYNDFTENKPCFCHN